MKIGIMTFHKSESHGAMLQAFALQRTLEKLGNETEIINYNRSFLKSQNEVSAGTAKAKIKRFAIHFISFIYRMINRKSISEKIDRFEDFRDNYLKIGEKEYHTSSELRQDNLGYDAYITGSDQVWNPDSIIHDAFYFTFLDSSKKTIAYAPSIGVSKIDNAEMRKKMEKYLNHVQYLSCRENTGAKVIESITNRQVESVLDPTLLLSKEEWIKIIPQRIKRKPYVLCYFLGSLRYGRDFADTIATRLEYDVVVIPQSPVEIFSRYKQERGVGPLEFLSLIEGAAVVCTDSFHGTAFSINFQKPFFSFCRRNPNGVASRISRLQDLLEKLNLQNRLIMPGDIFKDEKLEVDYDKVKKLLDLERKQSINYLIKALEN